MNGWALAGKLLERGLDLAIRLDRWLDERRARKKRGLSFKDVQHQQDQIARATRSRVPTVVLRRPPTE